MPELRGLLHAADSGEAQPVTLGWDEAAGVLHVRGEGVDIDVATKALAIASGGWQDRAAVHLVWQWQGRDWAVTLTEPETIQALAGLLSATLARVLDHAIGAGIKATRRGRLKLLVTALLVILALAILAAWVWR